MEKVVMSCLKSWWVWALKQMKKFVFSPVYVTHCIKITHL